MREKLLAAVAPLEDVPDPEKDWHPGSDGLVLDLVHPSLYPIIYGRTVIKGSGSDTPTVLAAPQLVPDDDECQFTSRRFQWLPSDFFVDHDGKVTLKSPYINNVHPLQHESLYSVIPEILQRAVPMFERVLSDDLRALLPMRIATSTNGWGSEETADCIWDGHSPYPNSSSEDEYWNDTDAWIERRTDFKTPDARDHYDGDLEIMRDQISLKDRTLQVIVKLANIVLTPEKPSYPGGKWHVEGSFQQSFVQSHALLKFLFQGMRNEKIVSSFIYVSLPPKAQ